MRTGTFGGVVRKMLALMAATVALMTLAVWFGGCAAVQTETTRATADTRATQVAPIELAPIPVEPIVLGTPTIVIPNTELAVAGSTEVSDDYIEVTLTDGRRLRVRDLTTGVAWHLVGCGVQSGEWHARENGQYHLAFASGDETVSLPRHHREAFWFVRGGTISLPMPVAADIRAALNATCVE